MTSIKKGILLFTALSLLSGLAAQTVLKDDTPLITGKNFRIHPGNVAQSEVFLVRSPVDQEIMFAGCNTISFSPSFFISEGVYSTIDGGVTWQGNDTCTGEWIGYHGGDPGITIDKNGTFILTRLGREPFVGLYSHYSYDHGHTWSAQKVISTDDLERAALSTDAIPSSQFYGRTYAAYVRFAPPYPLMFTYTDNGAQVWTAPKAVNNPANRSAGGDVAVGPGGKVYLCWAGVTDASPFKEILVGFASSSNGGVNWQVTESAFSVNGITGILANKNNIRVNGLPYMAVDTTNGPRRGWIYIITGQKNLLPAGSDPDIIMYRSTDGGATWSAGIRVNQDALNNGKTQYFPNIHIDRYGAVDVIFYDDRMTTNDSTGVMLARSTDGGETWKEYEISDHHFAPAPIGGLGMGYQGDIIDLTSTDSKIWTIWMDNSTGIYQVWSAAVEFSALGVPDDPDLRPYSSLSRCYPNPFHDETTIAYRVTSPGFITLEVFNLYGVRVASLVDGIKPPGTYEVTFKPGDLPAGALSCSIPLFYRLTAGDRVETGKMITIE